MEDKCFLALDMDCSELRSVRLTPALLDEEPEQYRSA